MSLPTLSKTWQISPNNQTTAQGSVTADARKTLRGIKNALIGFGTNPWAVRYSCSSTVAGSAGDAVDRWAADSDLVWNGPGSAHSWIVLRQTGISSTFEMLISCEGSGANASQLTMYVSTSAFSGGSTTARPTATDEVLVIGGPWITNSDISHRYHVLQSTDGQCTRIFIGSSGVCVFSAIIDKPNNPTTGWINPYFALAAFNSTTWSLTSPVLITSSNASALGRMRSGSTTGNVSLTIEGLANNFAADTAIGNIANEIDSSWDMWPLGIACLTTGIRGRHGSLFDLWAVSSSRASGDMIPGDGSNQFAVCMPFIIPWNGSTAPAFS